MFTNKHVIAALIITPILAVLGYYAVDSIVSETPHKAVAGAEYALVAKPNCRYNSGRCQMKNGNFEVTFTLAHNDDGLTLSMESSHPLEGARVALGLTSSEAEILPPVAMLAMDSSGTQWQQKFDISYTGEEMLQVVLAANGALYYGDSVAAFADYQTSYGKDFRQ